MALSCDSLGRTAAVRCRPLPRVAALLAGIAIGSLCGADTRSVLPVSVTVLPYARLTEVAVPASIAVSAHDVARGYVEVVEPMTLAVAHNTAGYVLEVHALLPIASRIDVYGLPEQVRLAGTGGSIEHRSPPATNERVALTYRLVLSPDTRAGDYPWPLQVAVRPL
jgi:hypothetical protein